MSSASALPLTPIVSIGSLGVDGFWPGGGPGPGHGDLGHAGDLQRDQGGRRGVPPPAEQDDWVPGDPARRCDLSGSYPASREAHHDFEPGANGSAARRLDDPVVPPWGGPVPSSRDTSEMWISIRSNIRTASAARTSLNDALRIALRGAPSPVCSSSPMSLSRGRWPLPPGEQVDRGASGANSAPHRRIRIRSLLRGSLRSVGRRGYTPRRRTSAPTSSERSRPGPRKMTLAIRRSSRISSGTTSEIARGAARTSSSRPRLKISEP